MNSAEQPLGPHLILTPDAGGLLELLQDLGHLDEIAIGEIVQALSGEGPEAARDPSGVVNLADFKRAVAAVLFERGAGDDPEQAKLLEKEWHLIFG